MEDIILDLGSEHANQETAVDSTITCHFEADDVNYTLNEVKALIANGKIERDIITESNPRVGRVEIPVRVVADVKQFIHQLKEGTFQVSLYASYSITIQFISNG